MDHFAGKIVYFTTEDQNKTIKILEISVSMKILIMDTYCYTFRLYVFRKFDKYKILVCGGDGTVGWVLQSLDNVGQESLCSNPPCAIVPLGTGNDLARVLRWGPGYTGAEDPLSILRDVIEAEEIRLDRWTVVFRPQEGALGADGIDAPKPGKSAVEENEDNAQIFVMNNYFGIGLDADLCYAFHTEREHNPEKFNSR